MKDNTMDIVSDGICDKEIGSNFVKMMIYLLDN